MDLDDDDYYARVAAFTSELGDLLGRHDGIREADVMFMFGSAGRLFVSRAQNHHGDGEAEDMRRLCRTTFLLGINDLDAIVALGIDQPNDLNIGTPPERLQ